MALVTAAGFVAGLADDRTAPRIPPAGCRYAPQAVARLKTGFPCGRSAGSFPLGVLLELMMASAAANVQTITTQVGRPCLRPLAVEIVQGSKENLASAGGGFGCQFISEACRAEEAECGVGGVVPGGGQQAAEVLKPAQLG
jgi:hypothetical protein